MDAHDEADSVEEGLHAAVRAYFVAPADARAAARERLEAALAAHKARGG